MACDTVVSDTPTVAARSHTHSSPDDSKAYRIRTRFGSPSSLNSSASSTASSMLSSPPPAASWRTAMSSAIAVDIFTDVKVSRRAAATCAGEGCAGHRRRAP